MQKSSMNTENINEVCCDDCSSVFEQRVKDTFQKEVRWGRQLCGTCIKKALGKEISKIGTEVLKSFTPEQKSKYASDAGKISHQKSPNNKGKFSTERWNNMTPEDQSTQVTKATKAMQDKLNSDPEFKEKHFKKVFKNSRIGFTSKGHTELHEFLESYGFKQHVQISSMEVDECNLELKLVVEFNGDLYHCNPNKWRLNDYNKVIKMTAKEKWQKDFNRKYILEKMGYKIFVVWEYDWKNNRDKVKEDLIKFIN